MLTKELFNTQVENGGIWVLAEASETMRVVTGHNYPDPEDYEREIKKYRTPTKYIQAENGIVEVSVTEQHWGGIRLVKKEDFYPVEGSATFSIIIYKASDEQRLVTTLDEDNTYHHTDVEQLKRNMVATGYITEEEFDKYINPDNHKELPLVHVHNEKK